MYKKLKKALKHTVIYSLGNISTKLVGFILLPLYTSYLSPAEYGILGLLEVSANIVVQMLGLSLYAGFQRWYYDNDYYNKRKSIFFTLLIFLLLINIIFISLLILYSDKIAMLLFEKTYFSYIIKLMFIVSSFNIFISIPQSLMRLQEKSILFSLTNIIKLIVTLSLTVLLIVKFNRGLNGIYEAQLIGFIVYTILIIRYVLRNIEIQFELKILKELIIFSYPLVIATISGLILSSIDRYLLNFLICGDNLVQVGLYSLGVKITSVIKIFIINSFKLASPAIFFKQLNQENNKRFYSKVFTYFTFVLIFAALGMSLFGNELVILFTSGSSYLKATEVIPILSLSLVFLGMVNVLNYGLIIAKKTKIMSMVVFIVSLSNVLLNLFFIPILESIGAAVANLFSQILFFIIIYKFTQKHYQIPYEIVKVFKMLVVAVFIFIMSLYLSDFNIYLRSFLKLVLSLSFPLFLYFWNFYDEIELQKLKEILEKIQLKIINH